MVAIKRFSSTDADFKAQLDALLAFEGAQLGFANLSVDDRLTQSNRRLSETLGYSGLCRLTKGKSRQPHAFLRGRLESLAFAGELAH